MKDTLVIGGHEFQSRFILGGYGNKDGAMSYHAES